MAGIGSPADLSPLLIYRTDLKLIQESDLKDVAEILQNEKWIQYWTMCQRRGIS